MKKSVALFFCALSMSLAVESIQAAAFTAGDVVAVLAGDGSAPLTASATAAFLQEYNPTTANQSSTVQTIAMPTAVSGGNDPLTLSGSSTSEGFLTLSGNGLYLMMAGYGVAPGTATPATSTAAAVNRVVGEISMNGIVNTTTILTDAYNGSNIRSATSTDGNTIWTAGNGGSGQGASAGVRSTTFGGTTSIQLNATTSNNRVVNIFNGQLYVSAASGTFLGVGTVGIGLPTASGQTLTELSGLPTTGTHSPYDYFFKDANTLYVADDGSVASGGGIQKWTFNGSVWSLVYTLLNNGTTNTAVRSLAGEVDGSGNAVLFGSGGPTLFTITDTGAGATATILATAPANTAFRGVELVPEPTTLALAAAGGVACLLAFRRKR